MTLWRVFFAHKLQKHISILSSAIAQLSRYVPSMSVRQRCLATLYQSYQIEGNK